MLRLEIDVDLTAYDEECRAFMEVDFRPAIIEAINIVGKAAVEDLKIETQVRFDEPTAFTQNAFTLFPAKDGGIKDPAAVVRVKPQQAQYLEIEIEGGTRRPGDYATTKGGAIIPLRDAPTDSNGNLPKGWIAQATSRTEEQARANRAKLAQRQAKADANFAAGKRKEKYVPTHKTNLSLSHARWITSENNGHRILVGQDVTGEGKVYALLLPETKYEVRFPFYEIVTTFVVKNLPKEVARQIEKIQQAQQSTST